MIHISGYSFDQKKVTFIRWYNKPPKDGCGMSRWAEVWFENSTMPAYLTKKQAGELRQAMMLLSLEKA